MKNLFAKALFAVALTIAAAMQTTAQESFAYQAVIRDGEGNLITNSEVELKFSLLNNGKTQYAETQTAKANQYGNISVMIGAGEKTEGDFAKVPWNTLDITLKVEVKLAGSDKFIELGQTKINPVPYAMYAAQGGGAATVNGAAKGAETLFEVNDREGRPVFAVTEDGIVVYVDDQGGKMKRSGFLVTGREASKGEPAKEYFSVTTDGTQIFVDENGSDKLRRSGFLVTGREASKSGSADYLSVDGNGTTVYVDVQDDKMKRSGFLVTGREASKDEGFDIFKIDGSTTTVYVDDNDGGKMRRSGFLVTGREAEKGNKNIVDITGSRTNLTTSTLSIAGADSEDGSASTALQLTEENITMNSDMAMDGGVRHLLDLNKNQELSIYLSDNEDNNPDGYDYVDFSGDFVLSMYSILDYPDYYNFFNDYKYPASFHDTLVVPLATKSSVLLFDKNAEETAILGDAVAAMLLDDYGSSYYINVWPLKKLSDFEVSFAMTDYNPTSFISGTATRHARFNVMLNSQKAYAGCQINWKGSIDVPPYSLRVTTQNGTIERGMDYWFIYYAATVANAVYGETVTIEATDIPADKLLDYWIVDGRKYKGNPLKLPITTLETTVEAVFKDESQILWVDGVFKPAGGVVLDGSENAPYNTIADALSYIEVYGDTEVGYSIKAQNFSDSEIAFTQQLNDKASYISVDFVRNVDLDGEDPDSVNTISMNTTVPVIMRNGYVIPSASQTSSPIRVTAGELTLEKSTVGSYYGDYAMRGALVEGGTLVLTQSYLEGFNADKGAGAYIKNGASLTLKGLSYIDDNKATQYGGGAYIENGATLNAVNCGFYSNSAENGGADVYVEAGAALNVNIDNNTRLQGVGVANGAVLTAVGEITVGHGDVPEVAQFDYIANPDAVVVKLSDGMDAVIYGCFGISNEQMIADGYMRQIGPEGKPVKSKAVYSKGEIKLAFKKSGDDRSSYENIRYTYYRNEDGDEYLYLNDNWNNGAYGYRNYWLVGEKIYCDTIYCYNGSPMNAYPIFNYEGDRFIGEFVDCEWSKDWEDVQQYVTSRTGNGNLLTAENITLGNDVTIREDGDIVKYVEIIGDDETVLLETNKGVVMSMTDASLLDRFSTLESLLEPLIGIRGKGFSFSDVLTVEWTNTYSIFGENITSSNIVAQENTLNSTQFSNESDVINSNYEHRKSEFWEIDYMFEKLRENNFTISVESGLNGSVMVEAQTYSGQNKFEKGYNYGQIVTLEAVPDDDNCEFLGWKDISQYEDPIISKSNPLNVMMTKNIKLKAEFTKIFTVTTAEELKTALNNMPNGGTYTVYIQSDEKINGYFGIDGNKTVNIEGVGDNVVLGCNNYSSIIGLENDVEVNIKNLTIDGNYYDNGNIRKASYGIHIWSTNVQHLTLENVKIKNCEDGIGGKYIWAEIGSGTEITENEIGIYVSQNTNTNISVNGGKIINNSKTDIYYPSCISPHDYSVYENVAFILKGNAQIGTISMDRSQSYPNYMQAILISGTLTYHTSDNPITVKFQNYNTNDETFTDITDLDYINNAQLLEPSYYNLGINIANEYQKFKLATNDYYIDETGYIRSNYVDLGLDSGTKWARCNIGANSPEEPGSYFAWGEITPRDSYAGDNYKYKDNPEVLPDASDAAYENWGSGWRMPTIGEFEELINNCYWFWTTDYNGTGVKGYIVYKSYENQDSGLTNNSHHEYSTANDAHIFLPDAGIFGSIVNFSSGDGFGYYWSSSRLNDSNAQYLYFINGTVQKSDGDRACGLPVRAVKKQN